MIDLELNTLLHLAIMIFTGMLFGRLAKLVKLPNVTGYLVGGLVIGPSILGLIPEDAIGGMTIISSVALGFIAFSIGSEFRVSALRKTGRQATIIAIFQAVTSIQEQTLTSVPKIFAILAILALLGGWMFSSMRDYTVQIFQMI